MSENATKHTYSIRNKKRSLGENQLTDNVSSEIETVEIPSSTNSEDAINEFSKTVSGSFNWRPYLRKPGFTAAPVSCFKHVALSNCWDSIVHNVRVEVRSPDCKTCCTTTPCCYWLATVIKVCGYWGLLRYDGFDKLSPHYFNVPDRWVNLCTEPHIHPFGWCAENGKHLVPPKSIEPKIICWRDFLMDTLPSGRTLPPDFTFRIEEHSHNSIKKGMKLEVVDKKISLKFPGSSDRSYARQSLKKTLYRTFEPDDATWDMFLPVYNPVGNLKFKKNMKLEAIDPLNLSTICVATVTEVLRNNYLMIGIDGMMAANGSDCFCYHASSPCIFPVGFCESHDIYLTPPRGYKGEFKWAEYLKKTKSEAAPVDLFHRDIPDHGFKEGMYLEAVDLMEPRLICVAYVTKVVGRLLKVHFDGWEDDYDQWCDCESPDLFPIGWCDVLGYRLEPPRVDISEEKKKKKTIVKKRKKRLWSKRPTSSDDSPFGTDEKTKLNDFEDSKDSLQDNSIVVNDSSSNSFQEKKKCQTTKASPNNQGRKARISKQNSLNTYKQLRSSRLADGGTEISELVDDKPLLRRTRNRDKVVLIDESSSSSIDVSKHVDDEWTKEKDLQINPDSN
ncbi:MBT domain-containing protein 1 [Trichonephila inaurata madagascariensis]|uniref:MBT domain-containing protein 1 n=1 Tax=Trichonephila inaurata madagascariensis TaxID=2747483 RepID=A0A8X7C2Y7_9ARAC|nr:MBT domain-containing protein 1 [Trichonephila inaurata madagascariensis]